MRSLHRIAMSPTHDLAGPLLCMLYMCGFMFSCRHCETITHIGSHLETTHAQHVNIDTVAISIQGKAHLLCPGLPVSVRAPWPFILFFTLFHIIFPFPFFTTTTTTTHFTTTTTTTTTTNTTRTTMTTTTTTTAICPLRRGQDYWAPVPGPVQIVNRLSSNSHNVTMCIKGERRWAQQLNIRQKRPIKRPLQPMWQHKMHKNKGSDRARDEPENAVRRNRTLTLGDIECKRRPLERAKTTRQCACPQHFPSTNEPTPTSCNNEYHNHDKNDSHDYHHNHHDHHHHNDDDDHNDFDDFLPLHDNPCRSDKKR